MARKKGSSNQTGSSNERKNAATPESSGASAENQMTSETPQETDSTASSIVQGDFPAINENAQIKSMFAREVGYWTHKREYKGVPMTLRDALEAIKSGSALTKSQRKRLYEARKLPERTHQEREMRAHALDLVKCGSDNAGIKSLPAIVPAGFPAEPEYGRRGGCTVWEYSGWRVVDLDDVLGNAQQARDEIYMLDGCGAAFLSPSGNGVKALFWFGDQIQNAEHMRAATYALERVLAAAEVQGVDRRWDTARLCFLTIDPQIRAACFDPDKRVKPLQIKDEDIARARDEEIRERHNVALTTEISESLENAPTIRKDLLSELGEALKPIGESSETKHGGTNYGLWISVIAGMQAVFGVQESIALLTKWLPDANTNIYDKKVETFERGTFFSLVRAITTWRGRIRLPRWYPSDEVRNFLTNIGERDEKLLHVWRSIDDLLRGDEHLRALARDLPFYCKGDKIYNSAAGGVISVRSFTSMLKSEHGLCGACREELDEVASEVDRARMHLENMPEKHIDACSALAGHPAGYYIQPSGDRILVPESRALSLPEPIEAAVGYSLNSRLLMLSQFAEDPEALVHVMIFVRHHYRQLQRILKDPGLLYSDTDEFQCPALMLLGGVNTGKSTLSGIISGCLGGRSASVSNLLKGDMFNASVVRNEVITADDVLSFPTRESRMRFEESLKVLTTQTIKSARMMRTDQMTLACYNAFILASNMEQARGLQITPDIEDKLITVKLCQKRLTAKSLSGFRSEAPYILHWFLNAPLPEGWSERQDALHPNNRYDLGLPWETITPYITPSLRPMKADPLQERENQSIWAAYRKAEEQLARLEGDDGRDSYIEGTLADLLGGAGRNAIKASVGGDDLASVDHADRTRIGMALVSQAKKDKKLPVSQRTVVKAGCYGTRQLWRIYPLRAVKQKDEEPELIESYDVEERTDPAVLAWYREQRAAVLPLLNIDTSTEDII